MQRGILYLTQEEVADIVHKLPMDRYAQTPLVNKLMAAVQTQGVIDIEVSEDELEIILDEMGIPDPATDTESLKSMRTKVNDLLTKFREIHY